MKLNTSLLALAATLITVSAFLPAPVFAQTEGNYRMKWQAEELLVASYRWPDDWTDSAFAVGVSKWEVNGQLPEGSYVAESWQVSSCRPVFYAKDSAIVSFSGSADCRKNGGYYWLTDILRNWTLRDTPYYNLQSLPLDDVILPNGKKNPTFPSRHEDTLNLGVTDSRELLYTQLVTGPYSWMSWWLWGDRTNDVKDKQHAQVTSIPLRWEVSGLICAKQNECQ